MLKTAIRIVFIKYMENNCFFFVFCFVCLFVFLVNQLTEWHHVDKLVFKG